MNRPPDPGAALVSPRIVFPLEDRDVVRLRFVKLADRRIEDSERRYHGQRAA
jgi:hypothetical protein